MIRSAYDLLNNDDKTLLHVQEKYKHVIIDEFQDNNFALNEVVRLVTGKKMSITVVGDDDQVIYSFRGANSYNINNFEKKLYTHKIPDPDILIRTGKTKRLSNFLLWQLAYTEIFFVDKLWPDFNEKDFNKIIKKFYKIKRNFGTI